MGDQTSENGQTLYKISESGLEELSIVESEDLYNSEFDNNDARHNYDQKIQQQMQAAALFKRSGTGGEKSTRHNTRNEDVVKIKPSLQTERVEMEFHHESGTDLRKMK